MPFWTSEYSTTKYTTDSDLLVRATGLLSITQEQYDALQSLLFDIGGVRCLQVLPVLVYSHVNVGHIRVHTERTNLATGFEHYAWR